MAKEKKPVLIFSFATTNQAISAEACAKKNQLAGRLIPAPREITVDCGMAWRADPEEEEALKEGFSSCGVQWEEIHYLEL